MRIILTIDYSPWSKYSGGAQLSTHNLATALKQRGHEVHVIYTKPLWESISVPANIEYQLHWSTLPAIRSKRKSLLRPLSSIGVARNVSRILKNNIGPTIVHCNGEEGGLLRTAIRDYPCAIVATPRHSIYPKEFRPGQSISVFQYTRLVVTDGKYLMQRRAVRNADIVVTTSQFAANLSSQALGISRGSIRVVSNGISEEFVKRPAGFDQNGFLIFFGRFDSTKGTDVLVEALGLLSQGAPETIMVGRGPDEERNKKRIKQLGLDDKVSFRKWIDQAELAALLHQAQLAVLPSRHESFGVAILNAMASGLPVVSTKVGAIPELIEHGKTGYLVAPNDPEALAIAIKELIDNKELASRLGAAGSNMVREKFRWHHAAECFEGIYSELLENLVS